MKFIKECRWGALGHCAQTPEQFWKTETVILSDVQIQALHVSYSKGYPA